MTWSLQCSACRYVQSDGRQLASLCPDCGQPLLVRIAGAPPRTSVGTEPSLWRYRAALPLLADESPVTLGEGMTPLHESPLLAREVGVRRLWVKDEGLNPTASFKARGLMMAVTRAKRLGLPGVCVPTAGNAGIALAAYAAAAGMPCRIYAPETTPPPILGSIRAFGAELELLPGHIGDAGKATLAFARESGFFNVATVREPYRVEGMKTMGFEVAEQLGWRLPDAIVYPTGGGEGTIGIWKAIGEMLAWGWLSAETPRPRMIIAQASGCAPLVRAFAAGADRATPWEDPTTYASGLRVPGPLGDRLTLRTLRESGGDAESVTEERIRAGTFLLASRSGIDAAPEGGAALETVRQLVAAGRLRADAEVVVFNTGSGASYRW
ncbi:MAG: threonine synthase [Gemmatimonadota bacterium]|jgi:threonine synthase|nr:threonine synthase [Gemmatimonadota bacterium]MDQ8146456.1 threonine synthase [Gemmatimonadota bacterium]MDQ8148383.1 threonine synthase [Gemmatimonadota bacterium]MDQ8156189.1 threonine synthase [Gemmatimonadota bacterium]MDQ8176174.1 threonine synthase [Gemmatimonadota bacterium]